MQSLKTERMNEDIKEYVQSFLDFMDTLDLNNKNKQFLLLNADETRLVLKENTIACFFNLLIFTYIFDLSHFHVANNRT